MNKHAKEVLKKTPAVYGEALKKGGKKALAFAPLMLVGWEFYSNGGNFVETFVTTIKDFMWPGAVVAAKVMNASPY